MDTTGTKNAKFEFELQVRLDIRPNHDLDFHSFQTLPSTRSNVTCSAACLKEKVVVPSLFCPVTPF